MFSKKATKIDEIFTINLMLCSKRQIDNEDFINFRGLFREYELYLIVKWKHFYEWLNLRIDFNLSHRQKMITITCKPLILKLMDSDFVNFMRIGTKWKCLLRIGSNLQVEFLLKILMIMRQIQKHLRFSLSEWIKKSIIVKRLTFACLTKVTW